jgi:undecaprenyl-diphosphatase
MNIVQVLILSVVEGFTEFLPVSSTGHLILASKLLGISPTDFTKSFEIVIQMGAICSVIVLYVKYVLENPKIIPKILVSFIPTSIIGLILYSFIKKVLLEDVNVTLITLFVGGIVIILLEKIHKPKDTDIKSVDSLSYPKAFLIGVIQSLSVVPGVSRAAATIFGGLFLGLDRKTAVEYSFLLAVPTMTAATALDLYKSAGSFNQSDFGILAIGFAASFVVAILAIKLLLNLVKKNSFIGFGIYRIVITIIFFLALIR